MNKLRNMWPLLLLLVAACNDKGRDMEVRTYELHRLKTEEALEILTPYIREGGYLNGRGRLISVREKEDRLNMIEDLLRKYDGIGEAMDLVLDVQVIEANGFTTRDTAIAAIEQTLRQTFRYRGYRLVGEARIQAREGTGFRRTIGTGYLLQGEVDRLRSPSNTQEMRVPIVVALTKSSAAQGGMVELSGTVTASIGKPTVLGQSTGNGAIILVIRAAPAPR
jgi:hypothetical protein